MCRAAPTTAGTRLERVYDAPLPGDVPRLRTLERWLLLQLAAVRRAIEQAEHGAPRAVAASPRYVIQWRWVAKGQPRRGIVHAAGCWMAKGETLTPAQLAFERDQPGRRLELCDACKPQAPVTG